MSTITGVSHPACLLLPEIGEAEFAELVEDIRAHGQRHVIVVDDCGAILDGRHRWRALRSLGSSRGWRRSPAARPRRWR
jgi:ParB-like chromosome segregation protein Spo0J